MKSQKHENYIYRRIDAKELLWLGLYFFLLIPPALVYQATFGLDESWGISINMAIKNNLVFGKDFIFTYGPLGFLRTKLAIDISKWNILLYELFTISCVVYLLRLVLKPTNYKFYICVLTFMVLFLSASYTCETLMLPCYLCFLYLFVDKKNWTALFLSSLLSILSFYIKINYGLVLILVLYITLIFVTLKKIITLRQFLYWFVLHSSVLLLSSVLLQVDILDYIFSSLFLINSYNDVMYIVLSITDEKFVLAMLVIGLYVVVFFSSYNYYKNDLVACYFYGLNGLFLYLLFKNGFVRADEHIAVFFENCPIIFGSTYFFMKGSYKKMGGILTFLSVLISLYVFCENHPEENWKSKLAINDYCTDIFEDVSYKNIQTDNKILDRKISRAMVKEIGQSTVDIIPWEISEIYYNKLNYCPRPIPQSYSAYDEYLDTENYEKYVSASAPEYVLFDNTSIDGRHAFWDESITKKALLSNYYLIYGDTSMKKNLDFYKEEVDFDEQYYLNKYPNIKKAVDERFVKTGYEHYLKYGKNEGKQINVYREYPYLLFKKRKHPRKVSFIKEKNIVLEIGKEYTLDSTGNPQYLYAAISYTLEGKIRRLLFQPPSMDIVVYLADGSSQRYKAQVPIMKTGVLINKKVDNRYEAMLFFLDQGKQNKNIVKIKFEAMGGFNKEIMATIKEMVIE